MFCLLILILPLLNILILGFFGNKLGKNGIKFFTFCIMGFALILVMNLYLLIIKGYFFYINLGV
jgi:NADH:ubiquinone oxidoreductase subunit 5 (subunit L)/multisubunit Na+/H+ antiporter MnhA subunit